ILIGWFMKSTKEDVSAILLGTLFPNSGNYGAPVMLFALGAVAFDYAIVLMVLHGFIISTVGIFIALFASGRTISVMYVILSIVKLPLIYGAAAGLLLLLMYIIIDANLMDTLQMPGIAAIPVVMHIRGMQHAEIRKVNFELRIINTVVLIRTVVSPL